MVLLFTFSQSLETLPECHDISNITEQSWQLQQQILSGPWDASCQSQGPTFVHVPQGILKLS